jgi:hypothetical protein
MVNILLQACNIWLLWVLLGRFDLSISTRNLAVFIFGFYALNASAIEWISVGHDLWVTGLALLFSILTLRLIEKPKFSLFLLCWVSGFIALLIKESGFVTLGIYFILLILKGKSPFRREFAIYSLLFIVTYLLYLYGYFITRTVVDREMDLGISIIVNIWYLISYLEAPISKRIAEGFPYRYLWILKSIKIIAAVAVPVAFVFIFAKSKTAYRFFILWSLMFISTIAITKWDLTPFALYPERTAGRFMYLAVPGFALALTWILTTYFNKTIFKNVYLRYAIVILYIAGNFLVVQRISQLYFNQQRLVASILQSLKTLDPVLAGCDSLVVLTRDMEKTPQIITSGEHLRGMIYVILNHKTDVTVEQNENFTGTDLSAKDAKLTLGWDIKTQRFMLPPADVGL